MKTPPERGLSIVRRRRQQFSFIRLPAYLRTRESFMIKIKPPERSLSIVRWRRQRLSFSRLPAYLRTRELFMIKIKPRRSEVYLSCGAGNDSVLADYSLICVRVSFYDKK